MPCDFKVARNFDSKTCEYEYSTPTPKEQALVDGLFALDLIDEATDLCYDKCVAGQYNLGFYMQGYIVTECVSEEAALENAFTWMNSKYTVRKIQLTEFDAVMQKFYEI